MIRQMPRWWTNMIDCRELTVTPVDHLIIYTSQIVTYVFSLSPPISHKLILSKPMHVHMHAHTRIHTDISESQRVTWHMLIKYHPQKHRKSLSHTHARTHIHTQTTHLRETEGYFVHVNQVPSSHIKKFLLQAAKFVIHFQGKWEKMEHGVVSVTIEKVSLLCSIVFYE